MWLCEQAEWQNEINGSRPWWSHWKVILGRGQCELMRWILVWMMPQVQDPSLELLTCSWGHYHCEISAIWLEHSMDASLWYWWPHKGVFITKVFTWMIVLEETKHTHTHTHAHTHAPAHTHTHTHMHTHLKWKSLPYMLTSWLIIYCSSQ